MQFKEYPSYKNSGVEWLGDVPSDWEQKPIWSLFKRVKRTNQPDERLLSVYRDYGVIPKDSRDDNHNRASEDLTPYQLVRPNDLVINKMKAWQGSIAISEIQGIVSPAYYIYTPKKDYHSKYVHFLIRSAYYIQSYKNYSKGIRVNQWDLESESFIHINLLLPTINEQQKIVSYLDQETQKIDTLIAKQEKLIALLEEQRKSVISHAVTKGLDPNAPMKDSGVEWLGDVPSHWDIISIKYLANCSSGQGINSLEISDMSNDENCFPVIGGNGEMGWTSKSNYKVPVLSIGRVGALCGNVHLINYQSWISDNSLILKVHSKKIGLKILKYILLARDLNILASKSAQPLITGTQVKNEKIVLPPLKEQDLIVEFIKTENLRINNLTEKQKALIEKLKEYRASIISHAVTGKIDVRELVA
ncbi:TPA: restriction endonuclease subunit S [Klebsiella quasipneumoniae subsp. quasipneumoniae]